MAQILTTSTYVPQCWAKEMLQVLFYEAKVQMVIAQYRNAANPLITKGINTTHQHFQMSNFALVYFTK